MTSYPQTIQVFLPDGDPSGLREAQITTRTVKVVDVPLLRLASFRASLESDRVAVYFLMGADERSDECYIGQTNSAATRLGQHERKDFVWQRALVAYSLTDAWTIAHSQTIERMAIERASRAGRYALANRTDGNKVHMQAPMEAECREYLDTIDVLLSTLAYPILKEPDTAATSTDDDLLYLTESGCDAIAHRSTEGIVVHAGSHGREQTLDSAGPAVVKDRIRLISQKILVAEEDSLVFTDDHAFASPSRAACVLTGRATNGNKAWKTKSGKTLGELIDLDIRKSSGEE